jgi:hypothetical protein
MPFSPALNGIFLVLHGSQGTGAIRFSPYCGGHGDGGRLIGAFGQFPKAISPRSAAASNHVRFKAAALTHHCMAAHRYDSLFTTFSFLDLRSAIACIELCSFLIRWHSQFF